MSTNEQREPNADRMFEERDRVEAQRGFVIFAAGVTALGLLLTRIKSEDSFLEGTIKHIPPFSEAIVIQAVALHATLLRAIWTGRFPKSRILQSFFQFQATGMSNTFYLIHHGWCYVAGVGVGSMWGLCAYYSLWWALYCVREAGERTRALRADSAAEKGHASTAEATVDESHPSTAISTTDNGHASTANSAADNRHSPKPARLTITLMSIFLFAGSFNLALSLYSGTINSTLTFFGPCYLTALIVAASMLHGALSLPRKLHGSNGRRLVLAYRCVGLIVFPCTCMALWTAMWYYKGRPLYPGVYCAGHLASAVFVGVAEVLEQSLPSL